MIECPNCSRQNEDEYRYCLGCGSVLPEPAAAEATEATMGLSCSNCNAAIPVNFKFCGACGTPVERSEAVVEATPSQSDPPGQAAQPEPQDAGAEKIGELIVIKPDGSEGAKIPVMNSEVVLGRSSDYEVLQSDPFLSPAHASVTPSGNGFLVKDLGSLNGVFLRIRGEVELNDGDQIRVGQELLEFHVVENLQPIVEHSGDDTHTAGSPDLGLWGRLSLVGGPEVETRAFVFSQDEVVIGREVGDIVFREDGFVSGKHARVAKVEGKFFLKDLGSSNGTYVRIRGDQQIGRGDLVLMGQQLFRLDV